MHVALFMLAQFEISPLDSLFEIALATSQMHNFKNKHLTLTSPPPKNENIGNILRKEKLRFVSEQCLFIDVRSFRYN